MLSFFVGEMQAGVVELPKKYAVKICFFDLASVLGSLSQIVLASPLATQIHTNPVHFPFES